MSALTLTAIIFGIMLAFMAVRGRLAPSTGTPARTAVITAGP